MSALSAIETPVAAAPEARSAARPRVEPCEQPLRAISGRVVSIPVQVHGDAGGGVQPRSSSIPVPGGPALTAARVELSAARPRPARAQPRAQAAVPGVRLPGVRPSGVRLRGVPAAGRAPHTRLRLTRRGRIVMAAVVVAAATAATLLITLLASGGAQATNHGQARSAYQGMHQVVVQPGQTLWSIAAAAEPSADPRTVVEEIMSANTLTGSAISAGQLLWVP